MIERISIFSLFLLFIGCYSTEIITSTVQDAGDVTDNCLRYPVAYLPPDMEVIPGQSVNLRLVLHPAVCPDEVTGFEWSQISGPLVNLTGNASDNTSFIAPPEYGEIVFRIKVVGRMYIYEDTLMIKVTDKIGNFPPFADADGDVILPVGYSHRVSANYSQGTNRANMKYLWMTVPESNPALKIESVDTMETSVVLNQGLKIPQILLLKVMENGLRSSRNIKLIHTNFQSRSVVIAPRLEPEIAEISALANSDVELLIKDLNNYGSPEIYWYQLLGEKTELTATKGGALIRTQGSVDNLVFAAFVKVEDLLSPPVLFRVNVGSVGGLQPPVADAGSDQKVTALSVVSLNGSKSTVSYPRKQTYHWKQVYGSTVTLRDSDTAFPSFTAPRIMGKLIFLLTVSDGYIMSKPDSVVIEVSSL